MGGPSKGDTRIAKKACSMQARLGASTKWVGSFTAVTLPLFEKVISALLRPGCLLWQAWACLAASRSRSRHWFKGNFRSARRVFIRPALHLAWQRRSSKLQPQMRGEGGEAFSREGACLGEPSVRAVARGGAVDLLGDGLLCHNQPRPLAAATASKDQATGGRDRCWRKFTAPG
jgi:hypothetical protein